jgi:hypothetical protein
VSGAHPLVVVSCGAAKLTGAHRVSELYTGSYFRAAYRWANSVTPDDHIYVLSAKYGLVPAGDRIESYDLRMGEPGSVTAELVAGQAAARGLLELDPVVVGGVRYVTLARQVWPVARAPFGRGGGLLPRADIGYQIQALNRWNGRVPETGVSHDTSSDLTAPTQLW